MQPYITTLSWYKRKSGFEHEFVIVIISYLDSSGKCQTIRVRLERSIFNKADRVSAHYCQTRAGVIDKQRQQDLGDDGCKCPHSTPSRPVRRTYPIHLHQPRRLAFQGYFGRAFDSTTPLRGENSQEDLKGAYLLGTYQLDRGTLTPLPCSPYFNHTSTPAIIHPVCEPIALAPILSRCCTQCTGRVPEPIFGHPAFSSRVYLLLVRAVDNKAVNMVLVDTPSTCTSRSPSYTFLFVHLAGTCLLTWFNRSLCQVTYLDRHWHKHPADGQ